MNEWRVTKYNPRLRDSRGAFAGEAWTSASDVGQSFGGVLLDLATYLDTEDLYVRAALHFLQETGLTSLQVRNLEAVAPLPLPGSLEQLLGEGTPIVEDQQLAGAELERACRLNLRSLLWCRLEQPGVFFLHFGHDYYMYIGSLAVCHASVLYAEHIGLFVEEWSSPYAQRSER